MTLSFHHVGYAVEDIEAAMADFPGVDWNPVVRRELGPWPYLITFSTLGLALDFDGREYGRPFSYHRLPDGLGRVELVDAAVRAAFLETWQRQGR